MKTMRSLLAILITTLLVAGCGSSASTTPTTSAPSPGGATSAPSRSTGAQPSLQPTLGNQTIAVAADAEPPTLDMTVSSSAAIPAMLLYNVLETLTELKPDNTIVPLLAKSWTISPDGLTYTFSLVDATFQDGTPFTADDVVWTFTKRRDNPADPQASDFKNMTKIVTLDPHTVQITLSARSNGFLIAISKRSGVIFSQRSFGLSATAPVGTGPFKFLEWKRGESLTLQRYDGYWGKKPSLATVKFVFIADRNSEVNALLAGQVDILELLGVPERAPELQSNPALTFLSGKSDIVDLLAINNKIAPMTDIRVRQAIAYAIDRKAIVTGATGGFGTATATFASKNWAYADDYNPYPYDPAHAKELLAETGLKNIAVPLLVVANSPSALAGQIIQAQLAAVGITAKIQSLDVGTAVAQAQGTTPNFTLWAPGHISERITKMGCAANGTGGWYMGFCDPVITAALAAADAAADSTEMNRQYQIATHRIADQAYFISLWSEPWIAVTSSKVTGYPDTVTDHGMDMRNVTIRP
jgi:peptide/nickel transport system substrate-binding protein